MKHRYLTQLSALVWALAVGSGPSLGAQGPSNVDSWLSPWGGGTEAQVQVPWRPPDQAQTTTPDPRGIVLEPPKDRRPAIPPRPPFELLAGDRVLFLGDQVLRGEIEFGYLETRLTCQYPDRDIVFRNYSHLTNHPLLGTAAGTASQSSDEGIAALLARIRLFEPSVVLLGYGTEAAQAGQAGVERFRAHINELLDGLAGLSTNGPPRLVVFSPLSCEDRPQTTVDAAACNKEVLHYGQALWEISTNRSAEFIDLLRWSKADSRFQKTQAERTGLPIRYLTDDGLRLNRFGYWRMTLMLHPGLRWPANNWRFGYMRDDSLRPGQFGIEVISRSRSSGHARMVTLEEILPLPNLPDFIDAEPESRPQCYIQISALDPGVYALRVDGQEILSGTAEEWARYEIISQGPSWNQAEELRRTIVRKNALWSEQESRSSAYESTGTVNESQPSIRELEATIARLRKPVQRNYEVVRVAYRPDASSTNSGGR